MTELRGVLFDYGGVMTTPVRESMRAWMTADGVVPESVTRTLKLWLGRNPSAGSPIHLLETGQLRATEFSRAFAESLETHHGDPVEARGLLGRIFAEMRPHPDMFELVTDLRRAGVKVGLLSNSWGNSYPRAAIDALFDAVVISGEVGMRKPNADIYHHALARLGESSDAVAFVDDAEANLIGARAVGLRTHLHTDPTTTRAALACLVPTLARQEIA